MTPHCHPSPLIRRFFLLALVGAPALAMACSGEIVAEPADTSSGGGSTNISGAGGDATSGAGGDMTSGTGGQDPGCPLGVPDSDTPCGLDQAVVCKYSVACQSGQRSLGFACGADDLWKMAPGQACDYPYDSCPGTTYYCDGEWLIPEGPEAPTPCLDKAPEAGQLCFSNVPGGTWQFCGYSCGADASSGWNVAECVPQFEPGASATWQYYGCTTNDGP